MKFGLDDFNAQIERAESVVDGEGKFSMSNEAYHKSKGISNSGLLLVARNAGDYVWSRNCPTWGKKGSADFGTALHTCLLEPEKMDEIIVAPVKGRDTQAFEDFQSENPDKTVLTDLENTQLKYSVESAMAHPTINRLLSLNSEREQSIFKYDDTTNVLCKIRPDLDFTPSNLPILGDVKTTMDIADWRDTRPWVNPLYKFNYGHQAAFYLRIARQHYSKDINEFVFIVVSKKIEMGRYPVSVFKITWDELVERGFVDAVEANLLKYKYHEQSNDWLEIERFIF